MHPRGATSAATASAPAATVCASSNRLRQQQPSAPAARLHQQPACHAPSVFTSSHLDARRPHPATQCQANPPDLGTVLTAGFFVSNRVDAQPKKIHALTRGFPHDPFRTFTWSEPWSWPSSSFPVLCSAILPCFSFWFLSWRWFGVLIFFIK